MAMSAAFNAYRSAEASTVNQRDLIVKLYQGMERFLAQAQLAMRNAQPAMAHDNCQKVKAILCELLSTLNLAQGGEVAARLRSLYAFFLSQVVEGNLRKDAARLAAILPMIASLREAWEQVPQEDSTITSLPAGHQGHAFNVRT